MEKREMFDEFFNIVDNFNLYPNVKKANLKFYLDFLFKGISFKEKSLLDIGGGSGFCTIYGAYMGADKVVLLEPELEGSEKYSLDILSKINQLIPQCDIKIKKIKFQDFNPLDQYYDIILLHNSINHLDEDACMNLLHSEEAKMRYNAILQKISNLAAPGANLIITDCSRHNFFYDLGLRNPFAPSIEWNKHQSPNYWINLLLNFCFINPTIRWVPPKNFRKTGKLFFSNRIISYFSSSYFCLTMNKKDKFITSTNY